MSEDELLVLRFVLWRLRTGDLPDDVREAATRLAASGRFPRGPECEAGRYHEPWRAT